MEMSKYTNIQLKRRPTGTTVAGMMGAGWPACPGALVLRASSQESERAVNKSGNTLISAIVAATDVKKRSMLPKQ
jgi:hypothetical protein